MDRRGRRLRGSDVTGGLRAVTIMQVRAHTWCGLVQDRSGVARGCASRCLASGMQLHSADSYTVDHIPASLVRRMAALVPGIKANDPRIKDREWNKENHVGTRVSIERTALSERNFYVTAVPAMHHDERGLALSTA